MKAGANRANSDQQSRGGVVEKHFCCSRKKDKQNGIRTHIGVLTSYITTTCLPACLCQSATQASSQDHAKEKMND